MQRRINKLFNAKYKQTLSNLEFSNPTLLSPIIQASAKYSMYISELLFGNLARKSSKNVKRNPIYSEKMKKLTVPVTLIYEVRKCVQYKSEKGDSD